MIKALLGFIVPGSRAACTCSGSTWRTSPLEIRARVGYMPESDAHIPGMNAVSFVAYCGELAGLPARRRDAARARSAVLRRPRRGALPQRRNLFDRHEAAHQAGAGAGARSRICCSSTSRPTAWIPKGRDEMLELVRDLAHNKGVNLILSSHLLPDVEYTCDHVDRHGQGADRGAGSDRRAQAAARARLRAAREASADP